MSRIYIASSWKNKFQQQLVEELRKRGHKVYDFKHPYGRNDVPVWESVSVTQNLRSAYVEKCLKGKDLDLIVVFGVPHAFPIEDFDVESVAVTDGPRLVQPLRELGYTHVVAELDAHSKTLGTDEIVFSDFGEMIRSAIGWLNE